MEGTGGKVVGTYEIVNGVVSITFGDEYVNKNKNNAIDGWLRLSAKADEIKTDTNNKTEIKFNDKCTVNVEDTRGGNKKRRYYHKKRKW